MTADGDPLRPSRLLLTSRGEELARAVREFVAGPTSAVQPPLLHGAGEVSRFTLPPEPAVELDPPLEIRVTAFAEILANPYRWALESRFRLRSVDDSARELDGGRFGDLAHRVLARFGRSPERRLRDPRAIATVLDTILDEEAAARFAVATYPAVHLQVEQLRLRLHGFAEWQAGWAEEGWEIVLVEGATLGRGADADTAVRAEFDVDGEPVFLRGRIDRVDRNAATGQIAILDYKTADEPRSPEDVHRKRGEWRDLQLPLYRRILAATIGPDGSPVVDPAAEVRLGYVLLSRDTERFGAEFADWRDEDLLEAEETAREVIRSLRAGRVQFDDRRSRSWTGDPLAPLLGRRQLVAAEAADAMQEGGE